MESASEPGTPLTDGWGALARNDWDGASRWFQQAAEETDAPEALEGLSWGSLVARGRRGQGKRAYDSSRRRAQAARTRREIVAAALEVFLEHGYSAGTMQQIAEAADVVVETIYRGFDGKAGLFRAVVDAAVSGGVERAERPVELRPAIRAVIEEPDPRRKVELYAATQPGIHARLGPVYRVLAEAAAVDPELEPLRRELEDDRLAGLTRFAGHLADSQALRPDMSVEQARDVVWTLSSHQVYEMLVGQRQWTPERYRDWLAQMLAATLLARGSTTE